MKNYYIKRMETNSMTDMNNKKNVMKKIEVVFDISYLLTIFISASILFRTTEIGSIRCLFAIMAFILGLGDSFHLIPRICSMLDRKQRNYSVSLGAGKFVASISMTIFYLFLWEIGLNYYNFTVSSITNIVIYGLAVLRIVACALPYNKWTDEEGSFHWGIIRNIPFTALGMMVMVIYMKGAIVTEGHLSFMWLVIFLSFLFYLPVVILSKRYPKIGMLMLPKSCAYVAIVLMGFTI